jgi:hypothetical protein
VNESQVFANALKLATPAERAAYLDEACAGNLQLHADSISLSDAPAEPRGTAQPGCLLAGCYKLPKGLCSDVSVRSDRMSGQLSISHWIQQLKEGSRQASRRGGIATSLAL